MARGQTTVRVDSRFGSYRRGRFAMAVDGGLTDAARAIERTAQALAGPRGGLERGIHRTRPYQRRRGRGILVISEHPGRYQHEGTYRKLGARRSTRGRADTSGEARGVKPLRYLKKALTLHRREFYDGMRNRLGGVA